ncbi:hypothetical protein [Microbacterium schleiferi]|uniref:hypothetical protein n=1 Tax=Microbacterium schleiferi TaxID=69362 RepID=UPI00311EA947
MTIATTTRRVVSLSLRAAAVALIAASVVGSISLPATAADDQIGVSGLPAGTDGVVDGRARYTFSVSPGETVTDQFLVRNTGSVAADYTVVASDAFNNDKGDFDLTATGDAGDVVDNWVTFEGGASSLTFPLGAGGSRLVPFTVAVPADATPGDHIGGVLVSVTAPGVVLDVENRVAAPLYVRVAGEVVSQLSISALNAEYVGDWWNPFSGSIHMFYTVENSGNVALATNSKVGAKTWFGIPVGEVQGGGIGEVLPGNGRNVEVEIPGVAALLYLNPWITLNPFVKDPTPETDLISITATNRDAIVWAVPWPLVIVLAIGAGIAGLVWWRRRKDAERAAEWMRFTEREAQRQAAEERLAAATAGRDRTSE